MRRLALALLAATFALPAVAQQRMGTDSGLPLPRFVSLKSGKVNMRVGPGRDYKVEWEYRRSGLPVEIVAEFDKWRRIRDADGTEGWVYGALLSGRRTVVIAPWMDGGDTAPPMITMHAENDRAARAVARLEPGVTGRLVECDGTWCRVEPHAAGATASGWVRQTELWGAYPGEAVER